jgi:hypothetical protein
MLRVGPEQLQLEAAQQEPTSKRRPNDQPDQKHRREGERRRTAAELLETHGALLTRTHLRDLGLERRAVDAVFRQLPNVLLTGYSRPLIRAADYVDLVTKSTYRGVERVHPFPHRG